MKKLLVAAISLISLNSFSQSLPPLHEVKRVALEKSYSCEGDYKKSAVFLSDYAEQRNSPDLLYNGACGSSDYIEASTSGDNFSLISDLGLVDIKTVSAAQAFNLKRVVGYDNNFQETAKLRVGHTYAVLSSKSDIRSLVLYTVVEHDPNGKLILDYAVKSYSIQETVKASPGFDWEAENVDNSVRSSGKEGSSRLTELEITGNARARQH